MADPIPQTTEYEHDWEEFSAEGYSFARCSRCRAHKYAVFINSKCRVPPPRPSIGDALGRVSGGFDALDRKFRSGSTNRDH
jgi:hypothetical protein